MKTDDLETIFKDLDFDTAQPPADHENRFRQKLKEQHRKPRLSSVVNLWHPLLGVAASILVIFAVFQQVSGSSNLKKNGLASVSPEMKQTQNFYATTIETATQELRSSQTPETKAVVEDVLDQLDLLEKDYNRLKEDLSKSGQDQRVIYAMISNFQKRIDLLNTVLEKIKSIKTIKKNTHENNIL